MPKVRVTQEAYRELWERTRDIVPGDYVSTDASSFEVEISEEGLERIGMFRQGEEDLSATLLRICRTYDLLCGGR